MDRITRRAHTLSQLLEDGYSVRAADMPGAEDLMIRVNAAMAQKERELISERTRAALAAAKARGATLGGGSRVSALSGPVCCGGGPGASKAGRPGGTPAVAGIKVLQAEGIVTRQDLAGALIEREVTTPWGGRK